MDAFSIIGEMRTRTRRRLPSLSHAMWQAIGRFLPIRSVSIGGHLRIWRISHFLRLGRCCEFCPSWCVSGHSAACTRLSRATSAILSCAWFSHFIHSLSGAIHFVPAPFIALCLILSDWEEYTLRLVGCTRWLKQWRGCFGGWAVMCVAGCLSSNLF